MGDRQIKRDLVDEVLAEQGGEQLRVCLSCGTCTATCPIQWWNPAYNPRRLIRQVALGQREVLDSPTIWFCSACDQCYERCPQGIRLSELMQALRNVAARAGIGPEREAAQVNERICAGCGECAEACPYEAVRMEVRKVFGVEKRVATVDSVRCLQCGICAAGCRSSAITLPAFEDVELWAQVRFSLGEPLVPVEARQ